jgi:hypothetical protein
MGTNRTVRAFVLLCISDALDRLQTVDVEGQLRYVSDDVDVPIAILVTVTAP